TACPFKRTVHAPQLLVSQPMCVPVKFSVSRRKCTSNKRDSTSALCSWPLTVTLIWCFDIVNSSVAYNCHYYRLASTFARFFERTLGEHFHHGALVLHAAA